MIEENINFLSAGFLWLLPAIVLLALIWKKLSPEDRHTGPQAGGLISPTSDLQVRHPLLEKLIRAPSSSIPRISLITNRLDTIVIMLVLICLVLALAEPVKTGSKIPDPPDQRDITFIVDASVSMLLRDYILDGQRIDRMSFLKSFLDRFVQQLDGDRISVVVFGDSAYTMLPLTDDQALTRRMLSRLKTTMAGRFNALGEAIALAVKESGNSPDRRRVLVLFTDADESTDSISPYAAAELALAAGLPLYTIAIGASTYDAAEEELAGLIYHPANIDLLKNLAEKTGAKSYQAGDEKALDAAIADINQREKYKKEVTPRYFTVPLYPVPLIAGLLLLSLYQFFRLGWSMRH
ncbi:MAG: VWA domain-containing protein [Gammaproteobacteria bacterium]|nr:VWA domain-containing protein [Gammaproteobacteria bacterium]